MKYAMPLAENIERGVDLHAVIVSLLDKAGKEIIVIGASDSFPLLKDGGNFARIRHAATGAFDIDNESIEARILAFAHVIVDRIGGTECFPVGRQINPHEFRTLADRHSFARRSTA